MLGVTNGGALEFYKLVISWFFLVFLVFFFPLFFFFLLNCLISVIEGEGSKILFPVVVFFFVSFFGDNPVLVNWLPRLNVGPKSLKFY